MGNRDGDAKRRSMGSAGDQNPIFWFLTAAPRPQQPFPTSVLSLPSRAASLVIPPSSGSLGCYPPLAELVQEGPSLQILTFAIVLRCDVSSSMSLQHLVLLPLRS